MQCKNFVQKNSIHIKSLLCGIPDRFIEHASRDEMLIEAGLSPEQIKSRIKELI